MANVAILILRLCLAIVFMAHGAQVAFGLFKGPGITNFASMLTQLGFKPPLFWAYLAAYTELLGGLFLLLGFLTRFTAASLLIFMTVAVLKVHITKGFFIQDGGFEYNFVLVCICLALIITGPGKLKIPFRKK